MSTAKGFLYFFLLSGSSVKGLLNKTVGNSQYLQVAITFKRVCPISSVQIKSIYMLMEYLISKTHMHTDFQVP